MNVINILKNVLEGGKMVNIEGERVAHNVGNYDEVVNDEGIVFMDNPYIIIFLSDVVEYAADAIADISKVIYL